MSLLPVRADYCTPVIFNKTANGTAGNTLPTTLTVQVESTPLIKGVMKRRIYLPVITKTSEAAASWAQYTPAPGTLENLKPVFRGNTVVLYYSASGDSVAAAVGNAWMTEDGTSLWILMNATQTVGAPQNPLDIETISKTL